MMIRISLDRSAETLHEPFEACNELISPHLPPDRRVCPEFATRGFRTPRPQSERCDRHWTRRRRPWWTTLVGVVRPEMLVQ